MSEQSYGAHAGQRRVNIANIVIIGQDDTVALLTSIFLLCPDQRRQELGACDHVSLPEDNHGRVDKVGATMAHESPYARMLPCAALDNTVHE